MQVGIYAGANDSTVPNFGVVDAIDVGGTAAVFGIPRAVLLIDAERGERRSSCPVWSRVASFRGTLVTSYICCTQRFSAVLPSRSPLVSNSPPFVVDPLDLGGLQQLVEK